MQLWCPQLAEHYKVGIQAEQSLGSLYKGFALRQLARIKEAMCTAQRLSFCRKIKHIIHILYCATRKISTTHSNGKQAVPSNKKYLLHVKKNNCCLLDHDTAVLTSSCFALYKAVQTFNHKKRHYKNFFKENLHLCRSLHILPVHILTNLTRNKNLTTLYNQVQHGDCHQ